MIPVFVADVMYDVDTTLEDSTLPADLQRVMRAWPLLAAEVRQQLTATAIASVAKRFDIQGSSPFDIDSAGDCEPQETPTEFEAFEAERKRLAGQPDGGW